jgi:Flp pilus assembly pilin Flp
MRGCTKLLREDRRGVTTLEYALMGALIFLAIVAAVTNYANALPSLYFAVVNGFTMAGV